MPDTAKAATEDGAFVAVVGPSGAGKDTILAMAAERLREDGRFRFARRVVTRDAAVGAEDHDCLSLGDFEAAAKDGAFCLCWHAHGLSYGLPKGLLDECRAGRTVVANVSRRALTEAATRFSRVHVVEVFAPRERLVERIAARGRETAEEIERRIGRRVELAMPAGAAGPHRVDNSGAVEAAAETFIAILRDIANASPAHRPDVTAVGETPADRLAEA